MARVLIVGCGCRGRGLATALLEERHAVRGTTRDPDRLHEIEVTGAEAAVADPDRLATLMPQVAGVSVICWFMAGVGGEAAATLNGPRLRTFLERLVDTHVRGFVYEAPGGGERQRLHEGAEAVCAAATTWRMRTELVAHDPEGSRAWIDAMVAAVRRVLR